MLDTLLTEFAFRTMSLPAYIEAELLVIVLAFMVKLFVELINPVTAAPPCFSAL